MKTGTAFILSLTAILTIAAGSAFSAYSGGTGEPGDPYQIAKADDLLTLRNNTGDYGKCFILTADIDLNPNLPGGQVFTTAIIAADTSSSSGFQGFAFTGTFDGNGHKITGFTINGGSNWYLGLFGYINSGSVKNLGLENCSVSGTYNSYMVGGLVGANDYGSISNCYSAGTVSDSSSYVGGLVGGNYGSVSNCYSTGAVSGSQHNIGGLVGYNGNGGTLSDCYSTGAVSGGGSMVWSVGGLAGENSGNITNCYSTGTVTIGGGFMVWLVGGLVGENDRYNGSAASISNCYSTSSVSSGSHSSYVGGLVGYNMDGGVSNCYSTGQTSGSSRVGGLVGDNNDGSIRNCYSTGAVSGSSQIGGLTGYNYSGSISNCYSTGAVSGSSQIGGLAGYNYNGSVSSSFWDIQTSGTSDGVGNVDPDPAGSMGKTTAEMKTLSTFTSAGWDFINVWVIDSGHTYPYLLTLNGISVGGGGTRFLIFPIKGEGLSYDTAKISAIFDHNSIGNNVPHPGIGVTAFTGEQGTIRQDKDTDWYTDSGNGRLYGYKKVGGGSFTVNGHYTGGGTPTTLYYEGHTGYDFPYPHTYEVVAAAAGTLHKYPDTDAYNTIYIDHGTYSTYYLHMLRADTAALTEGASVTQGQHLGYCGDYGATGNVHLHFTVKKGTLQVDPYGWNGDPGKDPYYLRFGVHNDPLWTAVPSPMTSATPTSDPSASLRPAGLSGHLNYWDVSQNQWVPMTAVPIECTPAFDSSRPTIVITHGWNDSISNTPDSGGSDNWTMRMAKQEEAIDNQNVNVLAWDWQSLANPAGVSWLTTFGQDFFTNVQMINDAAESARNGNVDGGNLAWELKLIGINPAHTQLVGHSNGGGLMGSAATTLYGLTGQKIQRLTTLDSPNFTALGVPVNAAQYILPQYVNEVEVYYSSDRLSGGVGAAVSGGNVFNGDVFPTSSLEHTAIPDWYTNLGAIATLENNPTIAGMNWSIVSPNRPLTWPTGSLAEQGANTGIFATISLTTQKAATLTTLKQMNFYSGDEYQGTHAATITDPVRAYVANLWGDSDGYLFKTITIPATVAIMTFDMKVVTVVSGDYITLSFGDKVLFCEDITEVDSNFVTMLPIPIPDLAGQTDTLLFTLHHDTDTPGSSVLLDNIMFSTTLVPADLNIDGKVNFTDFALFANHWLDVTCSDPNWCEGTDFDHSGQVDIFDLAEFAKYWLSGS